MSVYSSLVANRTSIRHTVRTHPIAGGSYALFNVVTRIPDFRIDKITVTPVGSAATNPANGALAVDVYSDRSDYTVSNKSTIAQARFLLEQWYGNEASQTLTISPGFETYDPFRLGILQMGLISIDSNFVATSQYDVMVQGTKLLPQGGSIDDLVPFSDTNLAIVARNGVLTGVDYSMPLQGRGNLKGEGNQVIYSSTSDILYIGCLKPFNRLYIEPGNSATGQTFTYEYWNGTAWTALTVLDATSAKDSSTTLSMYYAGPISWTAPAAWATSRLAFDPGDIQRTSIDSGTTYVRSGMMAETSRYWIRINASALAGTKSLYRILPLKPTITY